MSTAGTTTWSARWAGRTAHAEARRWIPHRDHEVFRIATHSSRWPRWLAIATAEPQSLAEVGRRAHGTLVIGRRDRAVIWTVRRRLRNIVTLDAHAGGRTVATLVMSFSCWNEGCAVELRLDSVVGSAARLRRELRRSLARLEDVLGAASADVPLESA